MPFMIPFDMSMNITDTTRILSATGSRNLPKLDSSSNFLAK